MQGLRSQKAELTCGKWAFFWRA